MLAEHVSSTALVAGQHVSNWALAHVYQGKRLALAPLYKRDVDVLEAGLEGTPLDWLRVGVRLAPQTIPAVKKVVAAAMEVTRLSADEWWSAPLNLAEWPNQAWPEFYDPNERQQDAGQKSRVGVEIRRTGGKWFWVLIDRDGEELATSGAYETRKQCEAAIIRILSSAPLLIPLVFRQKEQAHDDELPAW
jgi:uncharacterized protein YegP (UPF0339 family)